MVDLDFVPLINRDPERDAVLQGVQPDRLDLDHRQKVSFFLVKLLDFLLDTYGFLRLEDLPLDKPDLLVDIVFAHFFAADEFRMIKPRKFPDRKEHIDPVPRPPVDRDLHVVEQFQSPQPPDCLSDLVAGNGDFISDLQAGVGDNCRRVGK